MTKIRWIMVQSIDGYITRPNEPNIYGWTSPEDSEYFFGEIRQARAIIMGRKTYEAAADRIKLSSEILRLVSTHNPEIYANRQVPGKLEFSALKPRELVEYITQQTNASEILLVGGSQVAQSFLEARLITHLSLTIEPLLFGAGTPLLAGPATAVKLHLLSQQKLNDQGTLLLQYELQYGVN